MQHIASWLSEEKAKAAYDAALKMGLKQYDVTVWDKTFPQPRLTAWCCDTGQGYKYSGQETPPLPWPAELLEIRSSLESSLGRKLPCCLINYYRDGQDSVGWHKDDESQFGSDMLIACVSLGGERKFKTKRDGITKDFQLKNGDLFVFDNTWQHTIPKTAKAVEPRISLTYRTVSVDI